MLFNPSNLDLPWDSTQWDDLLDEGESSAMKLFQRHLSSHFNCYKKVAVALRMEIHPVL